MKKIIQLLFVALIVFLSSCSNDSPKTVARNYLNAYSNQNISKLIKLVPKEDIVKTKKEFGELSQKEAEKIKNTKFTIVSQKTIGGTAFVKFLINNNAVHNDTGTLKLIKENDNWKVSNFK